MTGYDYEPKKGLYRSREGVIFGVCRGLADYLDFPVFGMRIILLLFALLTTIFPAVILYIIAALLMKPEPVLPLEDADDTEFYNSYTNSRGLALQRLKRTFDSLDRRIQRMESMVTARDYDWERRFNE
jgi:phage shock protein C